MVKKSLDQVLSENIQLGFDPDIIQIAFNNVNGHAQQVIDEIFRLQQQSSQYPTKPSNPQDQDAQLSKAIEMSINEAKDKKISFEPLNPEQRVRTPGVPVGLKNIGNTCYFNSLLQTYFQNVEFVKAVLNYKTPTRFREADASKKDDSEFKRKYACCKLVENLKVLFCAMIASERKYIDPTDVVSSVVDDDGNELQVGDQKDIGQFNLVFLSRIDEGFQLLKHETEMKDQSTVGDSPSTSKIRVLGTDNQQKMGLINRSSIKIQQNSLINHHFIGSMQNSYLNQMQQINTNEQQLFSLLFVNIKNKELYKAVEQITIQHIDDYRNEKGEVVGVEKQSWIKQPPKTLFFQIDRVIFDKQKAQLVKINDEFDFPKVFFIDPFLLKNKDMALGVQKQVRQLRKKKQVYADSLRKLEKFGCKNISLLEILTDTKDFLQYQNSASGEYQVEDPLLFSKAKKLLQPSHIQLLERYIEDVGQKSKQYNSIIEGIDQEIEKCYKAMRSSPYYLYSILMHEGSAEIGHYYSYTYDIDRKIWRKFNDINISEEAEAHVFKEAKGVNSTNAYYLVYAQEEVLKGEQPKMMPLKNHEISSSEQYLADFYSQLIPPQQLNKIKTDNAQMHSQIHQFKMGIFANRVLDSYSKKFETCNQVYRKTKKEKKKNSPPMLTNFPIYLKHGVDEENYKSSLMEISVKEYGLNEGDPMLFEEVLKKKISSLNDFKKPKEFHFDQRHGQSFLKSVYCAQAARHLFNSIKYEEYQGIIPVLKQLQHGEKGDYFDWLSTLLCKVLAVTLLIEAEGYVKQKLEHKALQRIELMCLIASNFMKYYQEILLSNCRFWMLEISVFLNPDFKAKVQSLSSTFNTGQCNISDKELFQSAYSEEIVTKIHDETDIHNSMWNLSRHENTLIDTMIAAREQVKAKMEVANLLYKQMKKYNYPLKTQERNALLTSI